MSIVSATALSSQQKPVAEPLVSIRELRVRYSAQVSISTCSAARRSRSSDPADPENRPS
jgi:hypothetical protein